LVELTLGGHRFVGHSPIVALELRREQGAEELPPAWSTTTTPRPIPTVLFGPVLGTFVTLGATVGSATIAGLIGRRAGRESARALLGTQRASWLDAQIERRGLWAVVGQRFIPGISDALASYTFGAFGVPLWQMAVGALIGSAPRAFVYTALGASIGDLSSPLAYSAVAVWCVTAIIGAVAAHRGYRQWRGRAGRREVDGSADSDQESESEG
jgi:uncharacterized membrane protein YdjX (TVP38/TMEM64 family)